MKEEVDIDVNKAAYRLVIEMIFNIPLIYSIFIRGEVFFPALSS